MIDPVASAVISGLAAVVSLAALFVATGRERRSFTRWQDVDRKILGILDAFHNESARLWAQVERLDPIEDRINRAAHAFQGKDTKGDSKP